MLVVSAHAPTSTENHFKRKGTEGREGVEIFLHTAHSIGFLLQSEIVASYW